MLKSNFFSKNKENNKIFSKKEYKFLKPFLYSGVSYFIHTIYQFNSQSMGQPSRYLGYKRQIA